MILTVADVLKDAMGLVNAIEIDETPSASEMAVAMRTANVMIDRWSSQRLMLRSSTSITFTTTAGKDAYTIGATGADITASKIISLQQAYLTDQNVDYPLIVTTKENYNTFTDKKIVSARPEYIVYEPGAAQQSSQMGTLILYFIPDKAYTVTMEADCYLNEFTSVTDVVTFEPAYYEALIYNLAVRLFRRYSDDKAQVPADLVAIANNSLNNIKAMNSTRIMASMDLPGKVSVYNPYSDSYTGGV